MIPFALPSDYARVRCVADFAELIATPFGDGVNALCWPRELPGDFGAIVAQVGRDEDIIVLDEERLAALPVAAAGRMAVEVLIADLRRLREQALDPVLNCMHAYPRDDAGEPVATDVFSFHADRAPIRTDTWLCTYHGPASEGLRNQDARRRVDLPATRAELLRRFGGADDDSFREYLREHSYDLHYAPLPEAQPFSFGVGNLWRIAVEYPDSPVPPCLHRAPTPQPGDPPRLLLISLEERVGAGCTRPHAKSLRALGHPREFGGFAWGHLTGSDPRLRPSIYPRLPRHPRRFGGVAFEAVSGEAAAGRTNGGGRLSTGDATSFTCLAFFDRGVAGGLRDHDGPRGNQRQRHQRDADSDGVARNERGPDVAAHE